MMTNEHRLAETRADNLQRALDAETRFTSATSGADLIAMAVAAICDTQAELARLSGLTDNTLRAIKQGRTRATKAQRAALCWAVVKRWT